MQTVIDALVVMLNLNVKDYERNSAKAKKTSQDFDKQAAKSAKDRDGYDRKLSNEQRKRDQERERSTKKQVDGFRSVRNEVVKLAAIFTSGVGITQFTGNVISNAASLGFLAANLKMSTQDITAFQRASERSGGSAGGLVAQLKESADTLAQLNTGMGPTDSLKFFFRAGGTSKDLKDGNTYLMARSQIVHDMFNIDPSKAAFIARQMGISEDQFDFIKQGPAAINAMVAAQRRNVVVTKEDAAAALALKNEWLDFTQSLESTFMTVVLALAPAIKEVTGQLTVWANSVGNNKTEIRQFGDALTKFLRETDFSKLQQGASDFAGSIKSIAGSIKEALDLWNEFTGKKKSAADVLGGMMGEDTHTPGVFKFMGARMGSKEARDADSKKTGKHLNDPSEKLDDALGPVTDAFNEVFIRSLASFGNKSAQQWIRETTGKDDYLSAPDPNSRNSKESLRKEAAFQRWQLGLPPIGGSAASAGGNASAGSLFANLEAKHKLPSGMLDSIWSAESARGKKMLSPKGAMGHFGFMPDTATEFGLKNPNNLEESADAAARKMSGLLKMYGGDVRMAAAAYNWGQGNVGKYGLGGAPEETRGYMDKITSGIGRSNAAAAARMPSGAQQSAPAGMLGGSGGSKTDIHGDIIINTKATDAPGIARTIKPAVERYTSGMQANTGVN